MTFTRIEMNVPNGNGDRVCVDMGRLWDNLFHDAGTRVLFTARPWDGAAGGCHGLPRIEPVAIRRCKRRWRCHDPTCLFKEDFEEASITEVLARHSDHNGKDSSMALVADVPDPSCGKARATTPTPQQPFRSVLALSPDNTNALQGVAAK